MIATHSHKTSLGGFHNDVRAFVFSDCVVTFLLFQSVVKISIHNAIMVVCIINEGALRWIYVGKS